MNQKKYFTIAIDGYSAVGKTSCGKLLAQKLNYLFIDTGILFRAFTYHCYQQQIDFQNKEEVVAQIKTFDFNFLHDKNSFSMNQTIISNQVLFSDHVLKYINIISTTKEVRDFLKDFEHKLASNNNIVMAGRDIGTVVFPNADVKFFLIASLNKRAERRYFQQFHKTDYQNNDFFLGIKQKLAIRDKNDTSRDIAPLKKACDAITIDNSTLNLHETVEKCFNIVQNHLLNE